MGASAFAASARQQRRDLRQVCSVSLCLELLLLLSLLPLLLLQLRYVLMPGWTDGPEDVAAMLEFCRGKSSMQAIEVLPYHQLGVEVRACCFGPLAAPAAARLCIRCCSGRWLHA